MTDFITGDGGSKATPLPSVAILTFRTNGQVYGLPITAVRQLIEMVAIVSLPQAPPAIRGLINVHGQIVPVMDLRLRFGLPFKPYHLRTPIILLEINGRNLGLVVDEVETVIEVTPVDLQTSENIFDPSTTDVLSHTSCLSSFARVDRQIVIILAAESLLSGREEAALAQLINQPQATADPEAEMVGA